MQERGRSNERQARQDMQVIHVRRVDDMKDIGIVSFEASVIGQGGTGRDGHDQFTVSQWID